MGASVSYALIEGGRMFRKTLIVLIVAVLIGLGLNINLLRAQRYYEQKQTFTCEELIQIEDKLDEVLAKLEKEGNKEVLNKLDQILESQAQIRDELRVIKIRVSRSRR